MSKGKKKRRNKPREMPPLGLLDKCIYWVLGVVCFGGLAALWFWLVGLGERLAFEEEAVLAATRHVSLAWMFPGLFSLGLTLCGLIIGNYGVRQPIFGKPGVYYGPPLPRRYPLFWKDKPEKKPREKRFFRITAAVIAAINILCMVPMTWSVQGRNEWRADGTVAEVNMFGKTVEEYAPGDAEQVTLTAYSYTHSRSWTRHYSIRVELRMEDGTSYDFSAGAFRDGEQEGICRWLLDLQSLLRRYPDVRIENTVLLGKVSDEMNLSSEEKAILWSLFEMED